MKKSNKKLWSILFSLVVFCVTIWSVFRGEDLQQVIDYLSTADSAYIIPAILCVVLYILGESLIIWYLLRVLGNRTRFTRCSLYSFIGFFYCCITPSASGGQPMQVVAMHKDEIPVALSTVVLAIVTIIYKSVLVLIGAGIMLLQPPRLMLYLEPVKEIMYLGLGLNVVCVAGLLLLVFHPNVIRGLAKPILAIWNKVSPSREPGTHEAQIENLVSQYQGSAEFFRSHKRVILHVFVITLAQRFLLFLVTWLTYKSFHLYGHSMPLITNLQAMISVAVDMLPLPGGMGISETLFLEIFQPIFSEELVLPGMVISRGISYYTQLLISAMMTLAASFIIKDRSSQKESVPNR